MKFAFFTIDGHGLPIAYKLQQEGNDVIVGQVSDWRKLGMEPEAKEEEQNPSIKEARLKLYDGMLEKVDADKLLKALLKIKNKDEYFIVCDFNYLWKYASPLKEAGFKGLLPHKTDFLLEKDREKAKKLVEQYYPAISKQEHHQFSKIDEAIEFLQNSELEDEVKQELIEELKVNQKAYESEGFILEKKISDPVEFVPQVEVFNGKVLGVNIDIENKPVGGGNLGQQSGCFDRETEILTNNGWKRFYELDKNKDLIANLDWKNKRVIWSPILEYIQYHYQGKMHRYANKRVDLLITPNHRLWGEIIYDNHYTGTWPKVKKVPTKSKGYGFIESQKLPTSHYVRVPLVYFPEEKDDPEYFVIRPISNKTKGIKVKFEDWAEFLGLWMSDGYITKNKYGNIGVIGISQVKKNTIPKCYEIISKIPLKWSREKKSWITNNISVAQHLLLFCGRNKLDRRIPSYIKNSSPKIIKKFLDGFILGDGSINSKYGSITLYTANKFLADDLMEIIIKCGYWASIRTRKPRPYHIKGRTGNSKEQFEVSLWIGKGKVRNTILSKKKTRKMFYEVDFDDDVFCVSTITGVILVKRNGKAVWIGNCSEDIVFWVKENGKIFEMFLQPAIENILKKRQNELVIWDLGVLYSPRENKFYFSEFCASRPGYNAWFTEISTFPSVTEYFNRIVNEQPLFTPDVRKFGVSVKLFDLTRFIKDNKPVEKTKKALTFDENNKNIWIRDIFKEDDKYFTTSYDTDVAVVTYSSDNLIVAVENTYKLLEPKITEGYVIKGFSADAPTIVPVDKRAVNFGEMYYRTKEDFLSTQYRTSILNRFNWLKMLFGDEIPDLEF
jgi:hypothetical protein